MPESSVSETVLDLRGVNCPHVVLKAKTVLRSMPVGGMLVLECTDPLVVIDVPHFVNQTGHSIESQEQRGTLFIYRIRKKK